MKRANSFAPFVVAEIGKGSKFLVTDDVDLQGLLETYTSHLEKNAGHCQLCSRTYNRYDHVKRHFIKSHTRAEKRQICRICLQSFEYTEDILRHIRRVHKLKITIGDLKEHVK